MTENLSQLLLVVGGSVEASIVVKATIALAAGLLVARSARRVPAAARHLILASTFVGVLLLPAAALIVPQVAIEIPVVAVDTAFPTSSATAPQETAAQSRALGSPSGETRATRWSVPAWPTVIRYVWAGGALLFLSWLGIAMWSFDRLRRQGLPWPESRALVSALATRSGVHRPIDVVFHEDLKAPATCGWRRATVLLPDDAREWSEADVRRALIHELEHVRRGDWALQLLARAACSVFWFHPLAWMALRQMCLEAERACDDAVLQEAESTDYAAQLVELARRLSSGDAQPTLAMANRSDLSTRISAILDATQSRGRLRLVPAAAAAIATLVLIIGVAPVRAVGIESARVALVGESEQSGSGSGRRRASGALDRALYEAADEGDLQSVNELLAAGANVNAAISGDGSPLIGAAREGHITIVRLLLDKGADPNLIVEGDGSPLIMAAGEGYIEIAELLLNRGADVNLIARGDENALIQASSEGHLRVVQLLVTRGADVNARVWADGGWNNQGEWRTPLSVARKARHDAVVAYLISVGAKE